VLYFCTSFGREHTVPGVYHPENPAILREFYKSGKLREICNL